MEIGWYRKRFNLALQHKGKIVVLKLNAVRGAISAWINGQATPTDGSFEYELSPFLYYGNDENVIALRLTPDDAQPEATLALTLNRDTWLEIRDSFESDAPSISQR